MIAGAVALSWAGLVAAALLGRRPERTRLDSLVATPAPAHRLGVGKKLVVPVLSRRTLVGTFVALVATAAVFPPLAFVVLLVAAVRPVMHKRRAARRRQQDIDHDVAAVVTLLGLAVNAGHNLTGALTVATERSAGPVADAIRGQMAVVGRGVRLADALEALPEIVGEGVRPLVAALVSCDRYGASVSRTLDRLALDVRTTTRQRAEAAARKLPVRLLFPLVTCILPAFALLTVAPLIAGSFRELRL